MMGKVILLQVMGKTVGCPITHEFTSWDDLCSYLEEKEGFVRCFIKITVKLNDLTVDSTDRLK